MRNDLLTYLEELKARGLDPEREARIRAELATEPEGTVFLPDDLQLNGELAGFDRSIYAFGDLLVLRQAVTPHLSSAGLAKSLDELLERDRQREAGRLSPQDPGGQAGEAGAWPYREGGGCTVHGGGEAISRSDSTPSGRRWRIGWYR